MPTEGIMTSLFSFPPDKMSKEYKYLKSMFHVFQDSIYEEMEDKWLRRKAEWEKDEKMEREKILLQQKCRIIKKFELQSEEKKKKMNESISAVSDNFAREKEELLRQHDEDILQIQELRKSKEILEAELRAQATVLETLNTNLFQCQKELERQKTIAANLEKLFQTKLAEAEEKHKYNIKTPTEENNCLRQMLTTTTYEETSEVSEKSSSASPNMYESDVPEHNSNKKQAS